MKPKLGFEVNPDNVFPAIVEYDGFDDIRKAIGHSVEFIPYPLQLKRNRAWTVAVAENGALAGLPYNRWGLVGPFCVVKMSTNGSFLTLTDDESETIIYDLRDSRGYLDPACPTITPFREPFEQYGEPPMGWAPPLGKWFSSDPKELKLVAEMRAGRTITDGHQRRRK